MNCLSQEEVARVALGLRVDNDRTAHVVGCDACRAKVADMESFGETLARAHERFDDGHFQDRQRLMTALAEIDAPRAAMGQSDESNRWFGGLSMAQRTAIGVGIAAVVAVALFRAGDFTRNASAMERMAQNIRRAKSYALIMDFEVKDDRLNKVINITSKSYWKAPGSRRIEDDGHPNAWGDSTTIRPAGKPGIEINHAKKEYRRLPTLLGNESPFMMFDTLGRYSGRADRELGTRKIDGKEARGFEIDAKKIDPDAYSGPVEIWLDTETDLPVRIRYHVKISAPSWTLVMRDFRWNEELDPKLFDATPPAGFADVTPPPTSLEERVGKITLALKNYAELMGDHYPQAKIVYGDVTRDEMYDAIGIKDGFPTPEQVNSSEYNKAEDAGPGFARLNMLFRENPDFAYHGLSVGPGDKGKVLVRWQLDDGRYQVIFGDLRDETVTAERLRELEGK